MIAAVVFDEYGPPDVLRQVQLPVPQAGPGQVRARVRTAGVQPFDCRLRRGDLRQRYPVSFPHVLGNEFAGIIDQVGEGVTGFAIGDEVLGFTTGSAYAESVAVPAEQIVAKPADMPWEVAGVLSASGQTAYSVLRQLELAAGDTVLVHAAAGGVGTVAVQLARHWGATVIGTASARNHDYLRSLGAIPVSYGAGLADRIKELAPRGVDAALDAVGGDAISVSRQLVADPNRVGTIADYGAASEGLVRWLSAVRDRDTLVELVALYEQGQLAFHIQQAFSLARAADAHRLVETGHVRGKVVISTR